MNEITTPCQKITVRAEREVAYSSPDHIVLWGTAIDNSRNRRFNEKLYRLFTDSAKPLKILDLGCSGGGFVKDCLDDGCLSVGLEGSDYSKVNKRAEWLTIPNFLFTCDITGDFDLLVDKGNEKETLIFDVITCWELIEHIKESDLENVARNVRKHLSVKGLWIMSVSPNDDIVNGVNLHQTVKPKQWWIQKFLSLGFEHVGEYDNYFNTQYVRGQKYNASNSFHLILTVDKSKAPLIPAYSIKEKLYDNWLGSQMQIRLRRWIVGVY